MQALSGGRWLDVSAEEARSDRPKGVHLPVSLGSDGSERPEVAKAILSSVAARLAASTAPRPPNEGDSYVWGMTDLPAGTVTFLFTDIEGSTSLLQDLGQEAFTHQLTDHDQILRSAINSAGGVVVRTEGDAFFAAFETASAAVKAAVEAQRGLQTHRWADNADIRVRMGVHTGTGILVGDDYIGIDVHRAARIASAGWGGQILISTATKAIVDHALPNGVEVADLGEHQLKDIEAESIYQLVISGLISSFPAIRSIGPAVSKLPTQLTRFVGRQRELADVIAFLDSKRLLTLTGPGGTGKTRLAIRAAGEVTDDFNDGVYFVALAGLSDPNLVTITVMETLGLRTSTAGVKPIDHLSSYLASKQMLLVLDNFEHLIEGAFVVGEMLRAGPNIKILVTSRVPLRIRGEQEVPVPPLSTSTTDEEGPSESVELFLDRALAIRPDFDSDGPNVTAVAELTTRLEGLPLAIELAASRVNVLSPEAILDRLDNRLLSNPSSDLPSRQKTIVNTIGWSYDLLEEPSRRLFERCSVFVDGGTLPEIESVCGEPDDTGSDVLEGLSVLVDHSLIRPTSIGGETRYTMLIVIREFAYAALVARDEEEDVRLRHAAVYRELVEMAEPRLITSERAVWLDRIAADHDNIRAALDWAVEHGDTETALAIAGGMWRYWQTRGPLPEAMDRVNQALALPNASPRMRAKGLEAAGGIAYWRGDFEATLAPWDEAVEILREHGSRKELAFALYNFSFAVGATGATGATESAEAALEESRAISEALDDPMGRARVDWAMCNVSFSKGELELDGALGCGLSAVEQFELLDAPYDLGWSCYAVAQILVLRGDFDDALLYLDRGITPFLEAGDLSALNLFLASYAAIAIKAGDVPRGGRLIGASRAMEEKTGVALLDVEVLNDPWEEIRGFEAQNDETAKDDLMEGRHMSPDEAVAYALDRGS